MWQSVWQPARPDVTGDVEWREECGGCEEIEAPGRWRPPTTPPSRIVLPLMYSHRVPGVSRIGQSSTNRSQSHRQSLSRCNGDPL
jgi:hypothetical protein